MRAQQDGRGQDQIWMMSGSQRGAIREKASECSVWSVKEDRGGRRGRG